MTISPTPRLPNPLTPKGLEVLMRARPYGDANHPHFKIYRHIVQRGFEIMYPDTHHDEFGRGADTPLPPERIAHLVAQENEALNSEFGLPSPKRSRFGFAQAGERRSAGGAVHVQSHSRDGGKTEVADHWRAAPGEGGGENDPDRSAGTDSGDDVGADSPAPPTPPKDAHVAPDVERLAREWSGTWHGESEECVALVKKAVPDVGATPTWREGEKLKGPGDPPLEPGTAIATFENGKYPNRSTGNHAAIVIEPGVQDGKDGYWVLDQSRNRPAERRFIAFDNPSERFIRRLENYSVIRKGP